MSDEATRIIMPGSAKSTTGNRGDSGVAPKTAETSETDDALMREERLQRNLKILIGVMTAMIFAGLVAIAIRIVAMSDPKPSPSRPEAIGGQDGAAVALEVPSGAKVIGVTLDGDRMAIHYESAQGTTISVVDIASGTRIRDVNLVGAAPRN